jgi:predicted alpha/beta-hydrolase family hydrolase
MPELQRLDFVGYREEPVPHTFFRQEDETHHLAILAPGGRYTAYMPLLYYPMRLLLTLGADVLRIEYAYMDREAYQALPPSEQVRWLFTDVSAASRAALAQRPYQQVTLVGKSLGTLALGYLLATESALREAQAIWLTPLLWNDLWRSQVQQARPRSLFASGTADPHYDPAHLAELQAATNGTVVLVEGANHSLEIEGDVRASLQALEQLVQAVQTFL